MKPILRNIFHVDHLIVSALTLGVIGLLVFLTVNLEFLNPVVRAFKGFSMTDIYYRIQHSGEVPLNQQITLVDMTELTTRDRDKIAGVVEEISSMNPTVLGVDIIFEGLTNNAMGDTLIEEAFFSTPENTVLAFKLIDPDPRTKNFSNAVHSFFIDDTQNEEGTVNVVNNPYHSMTTYPSYFMQNGDTVYSLPVQMARMLGVVPPEKREFSINYRGTDFRVVDWKDLKENRDAIENRIVLLGSTRMEADTHLTPLGQMPGMKVVAYALLSVLEGDHISEAPFWVYLLWALLAGWLTNVIDLLLTKRLQKRKSTFLLFFLKSGIYSRLVSFFILALFTYISFILFTRFDYDLSSVLALTTSVLIGAGQELYIGILSVLKKKGYKIWQKSVYASLI